MLSVVVIILSGVAAASAQPANDRIWISLTGGVQTTNNSFSDSFDLTLYTEPEHVTVAYPARSGFFFSAAGGYRVWHQLFVGIGVTRYGASGHAQVLAQLPHPFFDNAYRSVEGTAPMLRSEMGAHGLIGWMFRPRPTVRVMVTAGPSYISAKQPIVTEVEFAETYPYDTAQFTGVKTTEHSSGMAGFNAGTDVFWMFEKHMGAGALAQFTYARVKAPANAGHSARFDAGGGQLGGGLRFVF